MGRLKIEKFETKNQKFKREEKENSIIKNFKQYYF